MTSAPAHVVVVGGGIAGLSTAWRLREMTRGARPRLKVTVCEARAVTGGLLRPVEVGGIVLDAGAESLLARRPEAVALARAVGLSDDIVHPATTNAGVWARGRLRALPRGSFMGVPGDLRSLAASGVLPARALAWVPVDASRRGRALRGDISVGALVRERLGDDVADLLVEPLLGGVYAGHADALSLRATVPALYEQLKSGGSLVSAVQRIQASAPPAEGPVFAGIDGGVWRLADATAARAGADIRTECAVREIRRADDGVGWMVVTGPVGRAEAMHADAVVVAVPALAASRVLSRVVPVASRYLGSIDSASVGIVSMVWPESAFPETPRGSGFLVPPIEQFDVKALTYSSTKWQWVADRTPGRVVLRASVGRYREPGPLHGDDELVLKRVLTDLRELTGVSGDPIDAVVTRWGGALPQYAVGHVDRVAAIRSAVERVSGIEVCGNTYDGVGVAACVASATGAADRVLEMLRTRGQ